MAQEDIFVTVSLSGLAAAEARKRYCPSCGSPLLFRSWRWHIISICGRDEFGPSGIHSIYSHSFPGHRWRMSCYGPDTEYYQCWTPARGHFWVPANR